MTPKNIKTKLLHKLLDNMALYFDPVDPNSALKKLYVPPQDTSLKIPYEYIHDEIIIHIREKFQSIFDAIISQIEEDVISIPNKHHLNSLPKIHLTIDSSHDGATTIIIHTDTNIYLQYMEDAWHLNWPSQEDLVNYLFNTYTDIKKEYIDTISPQKINIIVKGGLIQSIENIPHNISIKVIDFDTDGASPSNQYIEEIDGKLAYVSLW